jgi:hypothetical protein
LGPAAPSVFWIDETGDTRDRNRPWARWSCAAATS